MTGFALTSGYIAKPVSPNRSIERGPTAGTPVGSVDVDSAGTRSEIIIAMADSARIQGENVRTASGETQARLPTTEGAEVITDLPSERLSAEVWASMSQDNRKTWRRREKLRHKHGGI